MFSYLIFIIIFITVCVQLSHQLGSGAPSPACVTLLPNHRGSLPQETQSPYVITLLEQRANGNILIGINAPDRNLAGFLIQGRRVTDDTSIGSFVDPFEPAPYQTLTCFTVADSATHIDPTSKDEVVLEWAPPIGFSGQIYFTGTVLQEFIIFWGGIRSPTISLFNSTT